MCDNHRKRPVQEQAAIDLAQGGKQRLLLRLATLDLVQEQLLDNAQRMGKYAMDALEEIQSRHPTIGQVRGKGLMIGVEFVDGSGTKQPAHDLRERVIEEAFARGLLLLGCGESTVRLAPALSIEEGLLDEGLRIMEESISTVST
jgi:4-aminobutyrate aminotransferase